MQSAPAEQTTSRTGKTAKARKQTKDQEELVQTSFRLPRSRWRKLHDLSLDERSSVQAIIVQALEAEFAKRGITF